MPPVRRRLGIALSATAALVAGGFVAAISAQAAVGCQVTYAITNQWPSGFGANVNIQNLGDPVTSWRLTWSFGAGQTMTSTAITGPWSALAATESNPFARSNNVTFSGTVWTRDISHGEMVRASNDQALTISPCNLRYLYQGRDPNSGGDYNSLPWRLGLLTQTNSTC